MEGNISWPDKPPSDLEEAPENEETKKFAIIVRKRNPKKASSARPLEIDSLIIQSPPLKRALGDIFEDYAGVVTDVARLKFYAPFECYMHRWEELEEALEDPDRDEPTREHLKLLHTILSEELGANIQLRKGYLKNRASDFEHIWFIFTPKCTIITELYGQPVAARFNYGEYVKTQCRPAYSINYSYIEWDGVRTSWAENTTQITHFRGTKPFSELSSCPIDYHAQPEALKEFLTERGRLWEKLGYKAYTWVALYSPDNKVIRRERVDSRIVLNGARGEDESPNHMIYLSTISEIDQTDPDSELPPLTKYEVLLASPIVRGYALKNKRWMQFYINNVQEIEFNEGAFDSLVLPQERKNLILAFSESQVKHKDSFDDVVRGKGRGVIMLLSGGPGIGKTLTAEVVAEQMRVPLYTMSASDLGEYADMVDENLSKLMGMISNWNAVLLLDECDVFPETRSTADLARNRIVSILLRTLEYYEGFLFLTTNRIRDMDSAFQSRIHLTLEYPELDTAARGTIWKTFLGRSSTADSQDRVSISDEELANLSELEINGRQIKNIMKMAKPLAMQSGSSLTLRHVRTVLSVQGHSLDN